jgi:hypothetical protein
MDKATPDTFDRPMDKPPATMDNATIDNATMNDPPMHKATADKATVEITAAEKTTTESEMPSKMLAFLRGFAGYVTVATWQYIATRSMQKQLHQIDIHNTQLREEKLKWTHDVTMGFVVVAKAMWEMVSGLDEDEVTGWYLEGGTLADQEARRLAQWDIRLLFKDVEWWYRALETVLNIETELWTQMHEHNRTRLTELKLKFELDKRKLEATIGKQY